MAVLPAPFVLLVLFNGIAGYILTEYAEEKAAYKIQWPTTFHITGEEINFDEQLVKSFEVWYSAERNRSHVSYYGGKEHKYYYADNEYIYNVHMVTSKLLENELACFGQYSSEGLKDFLPDVTNLVYAGTDQLNDREVDVWKSAADNDDPTTKLESILYIYRSKLLEDIPVRSIIKKYNLETGMLLKHVITTYDNFWDTVSEADLNFDKEEDCIFLHGNFKQDLDLLNPDLSTHVDIAFNSYKQHHGKNYKGQEHEMRRSIFEKNWRMVHDINKKNLSYKLTINEFSDKSDDELNYLRGTIPTHISNVAAQPFPHSDEEVDKLAEELPENFDLRMEGVITPIKSQGQCGACWAFSTTAAVEGLYARIDGEKLLDLSEQSLIDCAWGFQNLGCVGGTLDGALKFIAAYGIPTEEEYGSYMEEDGSCNIKNMTENETNIYKISGFAMVTPRNPKALKVALHKNGPVAVSIHASDIMIHYANGIFYDFSCEGESSNHGVTVVGYGIRDGEEYWIVKNSWGEAWGQDGYILMSARNDNCFIMDSPFYPVL